MHLEPAAVIQAGDEEPAILGFLEQVPGIGSSGEGLREPVVDPAHDGGGQQHPDQLGSLAPQDLLPEVLVDQRVGTDRLR